MNHNLQRFIDGQKIGYETALKEMKDGEKQSHWIWYVFPQINGLGRRTKSLYYGISDIEEARAFLEHPVLRDRLYEITNEVLNHKSRGIDAIMMSPIDVMKFKSSMTLFDMVSSNDIFAKALNTFFGGKRDTQTIKIITKQQQ